MKRADRYAVQHLLLKNDLELEVEDLLFLCFN